MSKRGSSSAKFIGGKDWKNGRPDNDLNKRLKIIRASNRQKLLNQKIKEIGATFAIMNNDAKASRIKSQILREQDKNRQALIFKNIQFFKDFSTKNNLEFSIENYLDNKYYLKDYSGILDSKFGFSNLSIGELSEMKLNFKGKITNTSLKRYAIKAHIDYLIFQNTDRDSQ